MGTGAGARKGKTRQQEGCASGAERLVSDGNKLFVVVVGGVGVGVGVGVGASAGGLEALRPFVANLPHDSMMSYVIAQRVSPQYRSMMADLLARETGLPVLEVAGSIVVAANKIYITPPNTDVFVKGGRQHLREPHAKIGPKPSVDYLLASLAEDMGEREI